MSPATGAAIVLFAISAAVWLLPIPSDRFRFDEDDWGHSMFALGLWWLRFVFVLGIVMLVA